PAVANVSREVIFCGSPAIRRALLLAESYARTPHPVLLVGETGTGKELFAEHIHERSGRPGPLVDVNCGALPREMVESLLFGHRRGAFTAQSIPRLATWNALTGGRSSWTSSKASLRTPKQRSCECSRRGTCSPSAPPPSSASTSE